MTLQQQEFKNEFFLTKLQDALKRSGLPAEQLKELSTMVVAKLKCDSACQKRKKEEELKKLWIDSQEQYKKLPGLIKKYEKEYFVETQGEDFYKNSVLKPRYQYNADLYRQEAENKLNKAQNRNNLETFENFENLETAGKEALEKMLELYKENVNNKNKLELEIDNNYKSALTGERRVYYEINEINNLKYYNKIIRIVYFVLIAIYIIFGPFFRNGGWKKPTQWIYLIIFILLPFIIKYIIDFFYTQSSSSSSS